MPKYQVLNTETNDTKEYNVPVLRPAGILPVPYVSQLEAGALKFHNDCGPTCGTMLLKAYNLAPDMNPDRFFTETGQSEGLMTITSVQSLLARYKLDTRFSRDLTLSNLFDLLQQNKPSILLVNYGVLVSAKLTERTDFTGPHFFLAVGMDIKYVYIHDPYYKGLNGEARPYPIDKLFESWRRASEQYGNPPCSAIIPALGLDKAATLKKEEKDPDVNKGSSNTTALYQVKVIHTGGWVNIRTGPNMANADVGDVVTGQVRDIFEEQKDAQGNLWGRIGPGQWIMVRYDTAVKV